MLMFLNAADFKIRMRYASEKTMDNLPCYSQMGDARVHVKI